MSKQSQQLHLKFSRLCHFSEIEKIITGQLNDKPTSNYGIYIFGFVYECDEMGNLTKPKDCNDLKDYPINTEETKNKFIPYYVGKDANINSFNRIKEHCNPFGTISKTIRFTAQHMKEFYLGKHKMPIHYDKKHSEYNEKIKDWSDTDKLAYFNDCLVMEKLYDDKGYKIKKVYPINNKHCPKFKKNDNFFLLKKVDQTGNFSDIEDILGELMINNENFWFTYAAIEENQLELLEDIGRQIKYKTDSKEENKVKNLEILETIVFWALKGMTVSTISSNKNINQLQKKICLSCDEKLNSIFKYQGNQWKIFDNYCAEENIFPGYK